MIFSSHHAICRKASPLLALLVVACGDREPLQQPTSPHALDSSALQARPSAPWSAFAAARFMPDAEPRSPARHFRLTGKAVFFQGNQETPQLAELWLAAPDRMRYKLGNSGKPPNIFLLSDFEHCWVKAATQDYQSYASLALWIETSMRWHTLRFPWGWEETFRSNPDAPQTLARSFQLDTALGSMILETDADGLPQFVSMRETNLSLGNWSTATPSGYRVPLHWDWTTEQSRRNEIFENFRDRALFLDSAFSPASVVPSITLDNPDGFTHANSSDHLDVWDMELQYLSPAEWADGKNWAPGRWWKHDGTRYYVFTQGVGTQAQAQRIEQRTWLWWATNRAIDSVAAKQYLDSILPQLGVKADGEIWVLQQDGKKSWRRGFLLPVLR